MSLVPVPVPNDDRPQAPHHIEKGDGDVILFLHGVGGGAYSWMPQINSFGTVAQTTKNGTNSERVDSTNAFLLLNGNR